MSRKEQLHLYKTSDSLHICLYEAAHAISRLEKHLDKLAEHCRGLRA